MAAQVRKLLIAMDGSSHASFAFDWFIKYFYKDRDDVILMFCADQGTINTPPVPSNDAAFMTKLASKEETEIALLISSFQKLIDTAGIKGSVLRVSAQKPGEAIVNAALEHKVDIVVTGTRGLGKIRRTIMGSVSEYVVHHAKCPVLVVRPPPPS